MQASALGGSLARPRSTHVTAFVAAAALASAGTMMVPVRAALLPQPFRGRYMDIAIVAASFVLVVVSVYVYAVRRWGHRFDISGEPAAARAAADGADAGRSAWFSPLAVLQPEVVPTRIIAVTALIAFAMVVAAWVMLLPPWAVVSAAVVPWIPVSLAEGIRKYRHYGLYAFFGAVTLLQIGHLGEHTVQVLQMFMFNGDLSRAHGVFGQLDFESVHFIWDSLVWMGLGVLVLRYGRTNLWLWVSLVAASVHEIEHIYLFAIYRMDPTYYADGGFEGIMGFGGLVGSPLGRPYLHFAYNVAVIVPLVIAFWVQTKQVYGSGLVNPRSRSGSRR